MNRKGLSLKFKDIGDVLCVLVGDTFNYKIERFLVGFHRQVQASIAYIQFGGELLITSIVVLGAFEDGEVYGDICYCLRSNFFVNNANHEGHSIEY
jgi:hypothetical protein